jgi:hypothetical protein
MSSEPQWVEVEVPRGAYFGWGNQPGQCVVGKVVNYDETGGTDFDKEQCPLLELVLSEPADSFNKSGDRTTFEAGETIQMNCGQVSLKRAVRKADLKPGELVRIVLANMANLKGGRTVKEYAIAVARVTPAEPHPANGSLESEADFESDDDTPLY